MPMNVTPVNAVMNAVSAAIPKSQKMAKSMNLGEYVMPDKSRKNPAKTMIIKIFNTFVDNAKSKPDAERNVIDYVIILADKLKDINPVKYAA